jgi:hypothetical protein
MGIQVHRTLVNQRAHALGALRRSIRKGADADTIAMQQRLVDAFDLVLEAQGLDIEYDRDHAVEPCPKKQFFPRGAYRRDTLNILRRAQCPMRISDILDALCEMHRVELEPADRAHAAIKLAQGNWHLMQKGFVVRVDKEADYRSANCRYVLKQFASSPRTVNE